MTVVSLYLFVPLYMGQLICQFKMYCLMIWHCVCVYFSWHWVLRWVPPPFLVLVISTYKICIIKLAFGKKLPPKIIKCILSQSLEAFVLSNLSKTTCRKRELNCFLNSWVNLKHDKSFMVVSDLLCWKILHVWYRMTNRKILVFSLII